MYSVQAVQSSGETSIGACGLVPSGHNAVHRALPLASRDTASATKEKKVKLTA